MRIPYWMKFQFEELKKGYGSVYKLSPLILFIYILLILFCLIKLFNNQINVLISFKKIFLTIDSSILFSNLLTRYNLTLFIIFSLLIISVIIWCYFSILIYHINEIVTDGIFRLLFKLNRKIDKHNIRIKRVIFKGMRKNLAIVSFITTLFLFYYVFSNIYMKELSTESIIKYFRNASIFAAIVVYITTWYIYLYIRGKIKNKSIYDNFLFSKHSIRTRFKGVIAIMIFFFLLGWVLFPMLFFGYRIIIDKSIENLLPEDEYKLQYSLIVEGSHIDIFKENSKKIIGLPLPENYKKSLSFVSISDTTILKNSLKPFQRVMFLILNIVMIGEVGFLSVVNAFIHKRKRKALLAVFYATLKSSLLIIFLGIFIKFAFFIDTSTQLGIGTFFIFLTSFFLMEQSKEFERTIFKK